MEKSTRIILGLSVIAVTTISVVLIYNNITDRPKLKKQPTNLPVNPIEEPKSEFGGGRRHGGGGGGRRHHGGRPYPYYPYPMGVPMYPAEFYVNPDQLCEFKTASGKKLIANCDQSKALTLQNR